MGAAAGPGEEDHSARGSVLLLLATYANREGIAFPSIARMAEDAGFKVKTRRRTDRRGKPRETRECNAITAALGELKGQGPDLAQPRRPGRSTRVELLMPPAETGAENGLAAECRPSGLVPLETGIRPPLRQRSEVQRTTNVKSQNNREEPRVRPL